MQDLMTKPIKPQKPVKPIPEWLVRQYLERQGYRPEQIEEILHPKPAPEPTQAQLAAVAQQAAAAQAYQPQPWYQKPLEWLGKPLELVHEYLEEPWATSMWRLATKAVPGEQPGEAAFRQAREKGLGWLEAAKTGYEAWEAPWGVKGLMEFSMPLWWIPGVAAAKPLAIGARAARGVTGLGTIARGAEYGARGILGAERAMAYPIAKPLEKITRGKLRMMPAKPSEVMARWQKPRPPLTPSGIAEQIKSPMMDLRVSPTGDMLAQALKPDAYRALAQKGGKVPGFRQAVKFVGGEAGLASLKNPEDLVSLAYLGRNLTAERLKNESTVLIANIRAIGDPVKVLAIDEKGLMGVIKPLTGRPNSNGIYDVLDFPQRYARQIARLPEQQQAMLKALRNANEKIDKLFTAEGLHPPASEFGGPYFHRMAKGVEVKGELVEFSRAPLRGRAGEIRRVHPTQASGIAKGVVYEKNPITALQERLNAAITLTSNERMNAVLRPLWRTPKEKLSPALYTEASMAKSKVRHAQQTLGAIRRTERGESLPGASTAMIEREFPEVSARLREVAALPRATAEQIKARTTAFKELGKQMQAEIKTAQAWRNAAVGVKAEALARARRPGVVTLTEAQARALGPEYRAGQVVAEGMVPQPGFMGRIFPEPLARQIDERLGQQADKWLRVASNISSVSRLAVAALDFSAPFIHGLPILFKDPIAWGKATLKHFEFFFRSPDELAKWMARPDNAKALSQMTAHGSNVQRSEFVEALGKVSIWMEKKPAVRRLVGESYGRAERAFTGYSIAARTEMWKALSPRVPREQWTELARILDRMTGVMSTEALGIGARQKAFESGFLFFAPRYTRAGMALISDMFKGGLTGSQARRALGSLAAGGMATYLGICKVLGQEADLNPTSANFMTINVVGRNVGIGGFYYSMMRLLGNVEAAITDVAEGEKSAWDIIKPIEDGGPNRWDNPFIRFFYGRAAPLTGGIVELIDQENYFGEPFEDIGDYMGFIGSKTLPIWLQAVSGIEGEEPALHPAIVGAELGGMRTFPRSQWEQIKGKREEYSQAEFGKAFEELNRLEQERLENTHPDIVKLREEMNERMVKQGRESALFWNEWNGITDQYNEVLWGYQRAVDAGTMSLSEFRQAAQGAASNKGALQDALEGRPEYKEVVDRWLRPKEKPDYVGDIAYDEWVSVMYSDDMTDQYGIFNFEERNRREREFRNRWGDEIYAYVQERLREGSELPPLMREYYQMLDRTQSYWDVKRRLIALSRNPDLKELDEQATALGKRDKRAEDQLRRQNPALLNLQRQIDMIHKVMRQRDPELDEMIRLWYARA